MRDVHSDPHSINAQHRLLDDDEFHQKLREKKLSISSNSFELQSNPCITTPKELAENIAEIISNAQEDIITIPRTDSVINDNIDRLAGHILVQHKGKEDKKHIIRFRKLFFDENNTLDGNLEEFKDALKSALRSNNRDFSQLRDYKFKIANFNTCEETSEGKLLYSKTELPNDKIENKDIKEFFENLIFAVNRPDEVELDDITKKELGEEFNLPDVKLAADSFQTIILDWLKEKTGVFIDSTFAEDLFDSIKQRINRLRCLATNLQYCDDLEACTIKFNKNEIFNLENFLSAKNNSEKFYYYLVPTGGTILGTIKVYCALEALKQQKSFAQYNKSDSCIFIDLSKLLYWKTKKYVMDAFKTGDSHLLVINCDSTATEKEIQGLYEELSDFLKERNKKIIFIIQEGNTLPGQLAKDNKFMFKDNISFSDLTEQSKQRLLEKKVTFQGEKITLKQLYFKRVHDKQLSCEQLNQLDIDTKTLVQLVTDEHIEIGSRPLGLSNLEGAYSEMFEVVNVETLVDKLTYQEFSEMYVISGITGPDKQGSLIENISAACKTRILDVEDIISRTEVYNQDNTTAINKRIQVCDGQFNCGNFKQITEKNPNKKIYWINVKQEGNIPKFILLQIYNREFYIKDKRINNEVVIDNKIKEQLASETLSEIFIISVKGKNKFTRWLQLLNEEIEKFEENCKNNKIKFLSSQDIEDTFNKIIERNQAQTVHLLKFEQNQLIWCKTHGSLENLSKCRARDYRNSKPLIGEAEFINEIKNKQVVIIAGDPGIGKSTSLVKLCELELQSGVEESIIKSHWVISVNLKDHLQAIRNVNFNNGDIKAVISFLSQVDRSLGDGFPKRLLSKALEKEDFGKPLLLMLDGFDEVLDKADKDQIIGLLNYLKDNTKAKFWITTRRHYEQTLEIELSTFAVRIESIGEKTTREFIKKYLKNRLGLMMSQARFKQIFGNSDEVVEKSRMQEYTNEVLSKMRQLFMCGDLNKIIGTPMQLYLILEGSLEHFNEWITDHKSPRPDMSYLGNDIREVYKNVINRKCSVHFKKTDIIENILRDKEKAFFQKYHKTLTKSLILKSTEEKYLKKFEGIAISAGIIRSHGSNIDFIHPTFVEYFAAKIFTKWIRKWKETSTYKQEHLVNILLNPDYQVIRLFLNCKFLKNNIKKIQLEEKYYDKSILFKTAEENNAGIARFVLDSFKGTDVEERNDIGYTALHIAAEFCNWDILKLLLNETDANVNATTNNGATVLHIAVESGNLDTVKWLVNEKGANINSETKAGNTPMHITARNGKLDILKWLVTEKSANFNATNSHGDTILHIAALNGHLDIVKWLVNNKGANINDYNRVLNIAVRDGQLDIVKWLEDNKGANISDYNRILNIAVRYGQLDIIKWLGEKKGAKINDGWTLLQVAASNGHLDVVKWLQDEKAANINETTNAIWSVLHGAALNGHMDIVNWIVDEKRRQY